MNNFTKISNRIYVAQNQNGLNNSLYDCIGTEENGDGSYSKKLIRDMVENWPKQYPSIFIIMDHTFEGSYIYLEIVSENENLLTHIKNLN